MSYFTALFINAFYSNNEDKSENITEAFLFNFHEKNYEIISENYIKILYVLFVTVFEVYFITILKYETTDQNFELQLKI